MSIRTSFRATGETSSPPARLFGDDEGAEYGRAHGRPDFDLDEGGSGDGGVSLPITEILRGSDLDALIRGNAGSEFLYGGWIGELPIGRVAGDPMRVIDSQVVAGPVDTPLVLPSIPDAAFLAKGADIAQVLPGVTADEFLLSKDLDLPLVLPGEHDISTGVLDQVHNLEGLFGFPNHMLTLDPEGGFIGGTDDFGRPHDHDDWMF